MAIPLIVALTGTAWLVGAVTGGQADAAPGTEDAPSLVLVELFTSQGCSSCPPADRLLRELAQQPDVVPLAFHVDYWNHLGWRDPFSSARWSERQRDYAQRFGSDVIYTPQLVVDGTAQTVGSDRRAIDELLDAARSRAPRAGRLRVTAHRDETRVAVCVGRGAGREPTDAVWVALYERHLETPVASGENGGRRLLHDYVVRDLRSVAPARWTHIPLSRSWDPRHLGVVAFTQDQANGAVTAVARRRSPLPRSEVASGTRPEAASRGRAASGAAADRTGQGVRAASCTS